MASLHVKYDLTPPQNLNKFIKMSHLIVVTLLKILSISPINPGTSTFNKIHFNSNDNDGNSNKNEKKIKVNVFNISMFPKS